MPQTKNKIILFDLGNTLIYREKTHRQYDIELAQSITKKSGASISTAINRHLSGFPGVYDFNIDNNKCRSLENEDNYNQNFFKLIFADINSADKLDVFMQKRNSQTRYHLFPGSLKILKRLKELDFKLGVASNGRPSRRRIMKQLGIYKYFKPDAIYISDEMGIAKPSSAFFAKITKDFDSFKFALYDDEECHIKAAQKKGWDVILINHNSKGFRHLVNTL